MNDTPSMPRTHTLVQALSALAGLVALVSLLGHMVNDARLIALLPDGPGMSLLTAANVLLLAAPLWKGRPAPLGAAQALACWLALFSALCVLFGQAVFGEDVFSPWIAHVLLGTSPEISGRVSVATALGLLALGCATLVSQSGLEFAARIVEVAASLALAIAVVALFAYAYRLSDLAVMDIFDTMSVQSAVAIACLALARLVADPGTRLGMALRAPRKRA